MALQMQEALAGQRADRLPLDGSTHVLAGQKLGQPVKRRAGVNLDALVPARLVDIEGFAHACLCDRGGATFADPWGPCNRGDSGHAAVRHRERMRMLTKMKP